ncbi:hypothetical protein LIER_40162 [Lithospermum erythrorhizon]|uniref:Protein FAR1-RELATED SEQUENCE n=1 Tax=Lithospermum erythrorhizon TaxID=34254 RepID=A0AAV3QQC4_LITER
MHQAKGVLKVLGLDTKIDACTNDCMLYWEEHAMFARHLDGNRMTKRMIQHKKMERRIGFREKFLGIFFCFNHHKGTCVLGGTLLYEETATAFKWLFDTFIQCMNYKLPQTVMTNQAPAIAVAVRESSIISLAMLIPRPSLSMVGNVCWFHVLTAGLLLISSGFNLFMDSGHNSHRHGSSLTSQAGKIPHN